MSSYDDYIQLNLRKPSKGLQDNITLNLSLDDDGGWEVPNPVMSGTIEITSNLSFTLVGTVDGGDTLLEGTIQVPAAQLIAQGAVKTLHQVTGTINFPSSTIAVQGSLKFLNRVTGSILIPSKPLYVSGTIIDSELIHVSGSISIPETQLSVSGEVLWYASIFRGVSGIRTSRWDKAKFGEHNPTRSGFDDANVFAPEIREDFRKASKLRTSYVVYYLRANAITTVYNFKFRYALPVVRVSLSAFFKPLDRVSIFTSMTHRAALPTIKHSTSTTFRPMLRLWRYYSIGSGYGTSLYSTLREQYTHGKGKYMSWLFPWRNGTRLYRTGFDRSKPWIPPVKPPYQGDFDLNLKCKYRGQTDNIVLNLAIVRCYTTKTLPAKDIYTVLNEVSITRAIDGQPIQATRVNLSTDRDSWCWSFSMSIPESQLAYVKPVGVELPVIRVIVNNKLFVFLVESKKRNRKFGETSYTVTGRSLTALLDSPHAPTRTYTQPALMSSIQAVEEELDRITDVDFMLGWVNLVDENGWVLPENTISYNGLTPIAAIKNIVQPVGGVIVSDPALPMLHIKPRTPYAHWETPVITTSFSENAIQEDGSDWTNAKHCNGVYVYSDSVSLGGKVIQAGTDGMDLAEQLVSRMFTDANSIRTAGKHQLSVSHPKESTSVSMPMYYELGLPQLCEPIEVTTATGNWWGTLDSLGLDISLSEQQITINMSLGIERFLPESEETL